MGVYCSIYIGSYNVSNVLSVFFSFVILYVVSTLSFKGSNGEIYSSTILVHLAKILR
jgi:hypothetical protein